MVSVGLIKGLCVFIRHVTKVILILEGVACRAMVVEVVVGWYRTTGNVGSSTDYNFLVRFRLIAWRRGMIPA